MIWGLSILLSRVIGLVREAAIGRILGGGASADVYLTSFVLPSVKAAEANYRLTEIWTGPDIVFENEMVPSFKP